MKDLKGNNLIHSDIHNYVSVRNDFMHTGPFIYYITTFLGFFAPSPLRKLDSSTENKQKLAFFAPPPLQVLT